MTLQELAPGNSERAVIIGLAGSGKTALARELLLPYFREGARPLIIIDPKREFDTPRGTIFENPSDLRKVKVFPAIYRPSPTFFDSQGSYNQVYEWVYHRGKCCVFTDEATVLSTATRYPPYLKAIYHQGRSKGICAITCTQRPSAIPPFLMSESTRFYVFRLTVPADRTKVAAMLPGYDAEKLPRYAFYYYDVNKMTQGQRKRLELSK